MANESVCIEKPTKIVRRTVADGTGIAKGTVLYFSGDPNTASASSAADQSFAGIAIEEKTASDGIVEIAAAMDGLWDMKATTATQTLGTAVAIGGANLTVTADASDLLNGAFLGYVEETVANDEVVRVRLLR